MPGYISAPALLGRLTGVVGGAASIVPMVQSILNPKDNIVTALQNFGTAVENQFAPPGQKRAYVGSNPVAVAGNRRLNLDDAKRPRMPGLTSNYAREELAAGQAAEQFRPGAGFPGQQASTFASVDTPIERAEMQERSRIAQLTEQDPLVKKYQVAELTKAYNAASPEDKERIGLQIWATTNPTLAKQVRPGQVGYQTSAAMSGSQVFGKDIPGVTQATYQQASEQVGAPGGVQFPGSAQAGSMNAFGMGANAQQLGVSVPGQAPPSMIGENVFKQGFDVPSSENLTQTQLALLKRAFERGIK
jgi:hypothetical protein